MKKSNAIHQFTPTLSSGDGVSSALLFIQKMLQEFGYISKIYVADTSIDYTFKHECFHISDYKDSVENILLYHHSIGHHYHNNLMQLQDKKVMIYHNITPAHFFKHNERIAALCRLGRKQLAESSNFFVASIGDSAYNTKELAYHNYPNPTALPLLLDLQQRKKTASNKALVQKYHATYNILFVGRVVQNKMQHQLVDVARVLKSKGIKNCKFHIVGGASDRDYMDFLHNYVQNLQLQQEVNIAGKVSDEDLAAYYEMADLYLSLSEHEGFGMPLVEAMEYDIPVLAYKTGGCAELLANEALLERKAPSFIAQKILELQNTPSLRVRLIKEQKKILKSFTYEKTRLAFAKYLQKELDQDISLLQTSKKKEQKLSMRVEGPFDSTYSLAIVNRDIANALAATYELELYSTEGGGDFKPNLTALCASVQKMATNHLLEIDITLRNLYPPRTNAMYGYHKIVGPYGWEESAFVPEYVEWFNRRLSMVFTMSSYVKRVLRFNGVGVPIVTTGIVADSITKVIAKPLPYALPNGFRLLHISSAFPRKGIDILLEVFEKLPAGEFSLTMKTFPNPHNRILEKLKSLGYCMGKEYEAGVVLYTKEKREILLINKDIDTAYLKHLYENTDALVAPSFGEGFGLPLAEAMMLGLPVVTTAYGGQSDFCTEETAWLCDFDFDFAKTHIELEGSLWHVPHSSSLQKQIQLLAKAPQLAAKKAVTAKALIKKEYSSAVIAKKIHKALEKYDTFDKKQNIGLFSTYNTRCGIAHYSEYLISAFKEKVTLFANEDEASQKDDTHVIRCWRSGRESYQLQKLKKALLHKKITHLIIQYNYSFIALKALAELLVFCKEQSIESHLFLHATQEVKTESYTDSFATIASALREASAIYLHTLEDMNRLKCYGVYTNTFLFRHGISTRYLDMAISSSKKNKQPVLATFGFLLPKKGLFLLVDLLEALHKKGVKARLMMLSSLHPASVSAQLKKQLLTKINNSAVREYISLQTDFLEEEEIVKKLSTADKILFLYDDTQESSSAAVRMAMQAGKEIITTPASIFNDVKNVVRQSRDYTLKSILQTLEDALHEEYSAVKVVDFLKKNSWEELSKIFYNNLQHSDCF